MRITIHVKTLDEADTVATRYADDPNEVHVIVDQPTAARPAERQERKTPVKA
jgi:hypothetical protein